MPNTKTPQYLGKGPRGVYYFRYALSVSERVQLNQKELHWSLRTTDFLHARRLALTLHDLITSNLAKGRAMNLHYLDLRKSLIRLKEQYIQAEFRKIDAR